VLREGGRDLVGLERPKAWADQRVRMGAGDVKPLARTRPAEVQDATRGRPGRWPEELEIDTRAITIGEPPSRATRAAASAEFATTGAAPRMTSRARKWYSAFSTAVSRTSDPWAYTTRGTRRIRAAARPMRPAGNSLMGLDADERSPRGHSPNGQRHVPERHPTAIRVRGDDGDRLTDDAAFDEDARAWHVRSRPQAGDEERRFIVAGLVRLESAR
jgi:hypothetical protein